MNDKKLSDLSGIILAGGQNKRMGRHKALLPAGTSTIIEEQIETLKTLFTSLIIVARRADDFKHLSIPAFSDIVPDKGPLIGLLTGLEQINTSWTFLVACDMPFLAPPLIRFMAEHSQGVDAVIPCLKGKNHYMHALYRRSLIEKLKDYLDTIDQPSRRSLHGFLANINTCILSEEQLRPVMPSGRELAGCNTPEEYEQLVK